MKARLITIGESEIRQRVEEEYQKKKDQIYELVIQDVLPQFMSVCMVEPWKPETREKYFCVDNYFLSHSFYNMNDDVDSYNFEISNYFRTRERAEQVAKKMRLLLRLEQLHDQLCPDYEPDWEKEKDKFCLCYHHEGKQWSVESWLFFESQGFVWFDTFENAEKAAEILNKELEESK